MRRGPCAFFLVHTLFLSQLFASEPPRRGASEAPRTNQKVSAVETLRQKLGLSENVQIEWLTSSNGVDTISVVDNFNRTLLGPDWEADKRYWAIENGELVLTEAATSEWRYLAVFNKIANDDEIKIFSVSYRWGRRADAVGIGEGAHALMMSAPSTDADGYWCWRRTNQKSVWLYAIKNGIWEYTPGQSKEYDITPARTPTPKAGDVVEAVIRNEEDGVYFDYYINGQFDATVADVSKEFAHHFPWYTGVFIHGQNLNNQVDDFRVTWTSQDPVPPARVTDLQEYASTQTSITLEWSATGDNDYSGQADSYEIRYSTSPITSQNYADAEVFDNPPEPGSPGQKQQATIDGLQPLTTYYFAMRVFDEVGNASGISNVVEATTKSSGVATQLQLVEGCGQTGEAGKPLALKVVAKVLDQYGVAVSNRNVRFVIMAGGGNLQGSTNLVVPSDASGRASAIWTLGSTPGTNKIEIRSNGLAGSPIACTATAVIGAAAKIESASNPRSLYPVNTASDPLIVRVTDAAGNGVAGSAVKFTVLSGQGYLVEGQLPARKVYQTTTDANGTARATLNTGAVFGDTTKASAAVEIAGNTLTLPKPFFVVAAPPDSMQAVSGNQQTALLNTTLPQPIKVRVFDATGAPAAGHAVSFAVVAGGGTLGNGAAQLEMMTDSLGFAQTTWKLGPLPGNNRMRVQSQFKNKALRRSPLIFTATGQAGKISASFSGLVVSPQTGLLADSMSTAVVTVSVYDEHHNPVPGQNVRIRASGEKVFIKQPAAPTDLNGEATAEVRSTKPGFKLISAVVLPDNIALQDTVRVRFNEIAAARMRLLGGNNQTAPVNTILPQPPAVELVDKFGNPPKPTTVTFTVLSGGGTIIGYRNVTTDNKGQARAVWQLGPEKGQQKLEARTSGISGSPLIFIATGQGPSAVENKQEAIPEQFALLQNSPNPFNPETNIYFDLAKDAEVELILYDVAGRFIAKLWGGQKRAGRHHVRWNGRDLHGQPLESGVYLCRLRARHGASGEEFVATRKLTLLK